jgi:hypothetical protein
VEEIFQCLERPYIAFTNNIGDVFINLLYETFSKIDVDILDHYVV